MRSSWSPSSWQQKRAVQQPVYDDPAELERTLTQLAALPPLVTSWEVEALKRQLAEAARGERFLLQGGDCAEDFDECRSEPVADKLKILLQMSLALLFGGRKRVIRVGRFAGQYAKPRSADVETRNGTTLPCYRGDVVNGRGFTAAERRPDPRRMLLGYERAALTLNFIRALAAGGFADLHHPEYWDLDFVGHSPLADDYHRMTRAIGESIRFMEAIGGAPMAELDRVEFFTSHEGLLLPYEQAQTRQVPHRDGWYNLSTHFPWIGERTRALDEAHVEYFRGIRNPIGVKIGPSITPEALLALIDALDPDDEPGRLTLIHRFGLNKIEACLPPLVQAVRNVGRTPLWCCDPMHGNTRTTQNGYKTRSFDDIRGELDHAFAIHEAAGSVLGGVHVELTGENVTECVGGARGLAEADLERCYRSQVDPRLNYEQSLELALLIARRMARTAR